MIGAHIDLDGAAGYGRKDGDPKREAERCSNATRQTIATAASTHAAESMADCIKTLSRYQGIVPLSDASSARRQLSQRTMRGQEKVLRHNN